MKKERTTCGLNILYEKIVKYNSFPTYEIIWYI